jgi:hypothetical protein
MINLRLQWGRFMKEFVVSINQLIRWNGCFVVLGFIGWLLNDCFRYYKGYESCRKFRDVQLTLAAILHHIIKPWLFSCWALDFIGQIHPGSSKGHWFVLVITDYFTKWIEAILLKNMMHKEVTHFILEHTPNIDHGSRFVVYVSPSLWICRVS